jgi:hypothetical protein
MAAGFGPVARVVISQINEQYSDWMVKKLALLGLHINC